MKQDIENQYDDDLTLGSDEYDDSYYTDADDLFEFSTNDESPISRLKSLVLSIDWEITDEVLLQFNEELIDLKGIWAGNSINLVYVQALEKLSKYIYQNKANSHPNAIKLLLTLYYNLEKIVSSEDLSETQKKEILLEDVKRFEALKRQISQKGKSAQALPSARPQTVKVTKEGALEDKLLNLKAIVLGIDWEITDQDLNDLRREVIHLEDQFADSRPKLILLQGIGTLGAYIKTKKSNAHADAFKVLHLFYESLEKIVKTPMSLEEEKAILFPVVGKFNDFKALLGPTISPEAIGREEDEEEDEEFEESSSGEIAPALADVSDEEIGFQAEEEAKSLGIDTTQGVSGHIDSFFSESVPPPGAEDREDYFIDSSELPAKENTSAAGFHDAVVTSTVERDVALQGVDVGADDEEEDTDDYKSGVAALADAEDDVVSEWKEMSDDAAGEVALAMDDQHLAIPSSVEEIAKATDSLFPDAEVPSSGIEYGGIDRNVALQGVNVETEADEDSDEISLPMDGEQIAPALVASEEESLFSAKTLESSVPGELSEEIAGTLDDLFLDEKVPAFIALETAVNEDFIDEPSREEALEETAVESVHIEDQPVVEESVDEVDTENHEISAIQEEEDLSLFFTGSDLEQSAEESAAVDSLFESLEPALIEENEGESVSAEIDKQAESLSVQEEHPEESGWEIPASAADEVTLAEEGAPSLQEEILPAEEEITDEITLVEDEVSQAEEEIPLFEGDVQLAEEDISIIEEEIPTAEEEIALAEEPPAVEEMLSFKDTDVPVEEEISLMEEISPVEEEISPIEEKIAPSEEDFSIEEIVPSEEEITLTEEISLLEEETSPVSAVAEETSLDIEQLYDESLAETDSATPLYPAGETASLAATTLPEKEVEEEEVVFELVGAEDEPAPAPTVAHAPEEPEFAFTDEPEFASTDEVIEDLSPTFLDPVQEETLSSAAAAFTGVTGEVPRDPLAGLRGCIESLGIELNDKIINGLYQEINDLRQKWSNRPLEKIFLQLLSTITQHIDRYRFEASSDAHNLLHSVYTALSARREEDMHYNQGLLLMESLKVLEWQQGMLTRQAVQKGSQLMFTAPVRTEEEEVGSVVVDAQQDFDQLLQEYQETEEAGPSADEPLEVQTGHQTGLGRESLAVELKQEIATLRMTLQQEIAELRSELKGR